jgi:hypothetical protein
MSQRLFAISSVLLMTAAAVCSAQSITTARSGTLHYFEGDVSIDGSQILPQKGTFPQIKEQGVLRTGLGRAEVLLTPGVFLRVGENSAIRMIDERLISTRVEILQGTSMVESNDPNMSVKDSPITFIYGSYEIHPLKHGLMEISADPAQLKIFKGEAEVVSTGGDRVLVKEGRLAPLTAALEAEKFADKTGDDLYVWTRDRSESLAAANVASAQSLNSNSGYSGYGYANSGLYGNSPWQGGWFFNPYYSMFTYVPASGVFWDPFGYGYFSPGVVNYYAPTQLGAISRGTGLSPVAVRGGSLVGAPSLGSPVRGGGAVRSPGISSVGVSPSRGVGTVASSGFGGSRGGGGGGAVAASGGHAGGGHR